MRKLHSSNTLGEGAGCAKITGVHGSRHQPHHAAICQQRCTRTAADLLDLFTGCLSLFSAYIIKIENRKNIKIDNRTLKVLQ